MTKFIEIISEENMEGAIVFPNQKAVALLVEIMRKIESDFFFSPKGFMENLIKHFASIVERGDETASFNYTVCLTAFYKMYPDEKTKEVIGGK